MRILPMAKTVLKSLFRKASSQLYPLITKEYYPATRGKVLNDTEFCIYCGMCQRKCPAGAIEVIRAKRYWALDSKRCVTCNYCVEVCPKRCMTMDKRYTAPSTN